MLGVWPVKRHNKRLFCITTQALWKLFYFHRVIIAALHWNEQQNKEQAKTKKGELRWTIAVPKYKKRAIAKPVKEEPTFGKHSKWLAPQMFINNEVF